ncbi:leucine-rich repeat domain-containing protein [Escherichia coli]|uniref:leucine-rich repeat domain-containing protein n=1 Tax=Escherichia coli TaxID=562 RepID=UPI0010C4E25C|nr:leucine-rich repeat domain-containing protein [Escherichia coli]EFB3383831.1 leucine-rich repeat domain-containing protein [Escherichia coli]GDM07586.1 T3SS secreted effector EspR [Escherichia coli]
MKTITLNDNHIAHLNAKNTTKLEYLNLSNNNLLPTNDIDQLISSKHLWHVLVNVINNDPLAQMQYWTAVRNIIDDTNEVTIDYALESINFPQGRNVSITHISMNNNALRNIDIDRLSSVTYFSAAHNQLEFVQLESCEWLQYLNLSHNQLTDIVAGNKNELLLLDLSHNKLTSLHNDLFPNLNTLLINNNLLSEIKIFYSNFCNVQTLNAANNQLKYINLDFLTYLPSIKSLRLDNNKITHIDTNNTSDIGTLFPIIKQSKNLNFLNVSGKNNCPTMQLMLFNLFSPALKLNTGLAILSPGAFEVHSDGIDVDNELFHYPIKKAYTPYNIHTYKTEEVVNQRNIKVKNMTLDEINNTYCNNDYYNQAIREEPIDLLDRSFSSSSWPF